MGPTHSQPWVLVGRTAMNKVGILVLFIFGMVGLAMLSSVTSSAKPKKPVSVLRVRAYYGRRETYAEGLLGEIGAATAKPITKIRREALRRSPFGHHEDRTPTHRRAGG